MENERNSVDLNNELKVFEFCKDYSINSNIGEVSNVEIVSGGMVNFVYRLECTAKSNTDRNSSKSFILKYYPPYLSSDATVSFCQDRYYVEKEGLQLGNDLCQLNLHIHVPLIKFIDDINHVIIMEDLGEIRSLFNELSLTGVSNYNKNDINSLGKYITEFLLALSECQVSNNVFDGITKLDLLQHHVYGGYAERIQQYKCLQSFCPLVDEIQNAMTNASLSSLFKNKLCFGDFWPNALFLGGNIDGNTVLYFTCCLIRMNISIYDSLH